MKDYSNYSAVELAQDEDFILWVESDQKDKAIHAYWQEWIAQHPDKVDTVDEARRIIKAVVNERQYFLHDSKQQEMWSRIENSIAPEKRTFYPVKKIWYSVAACALLTAAIFYLYEKPIFKSDYSAYSHSSGQLRKYLNEGNTPHSVVLEDGSIVTLQPRSSIEYPEIFSETRRDVYLDGEAFFEVTRNAQKPFSVYANEIVTRVLGTSFSVRAYAKEKDVVVAVKTGKVSVFTEAESRLATDPSQNLLGTLLTPNQQIVFSKDQARMIKSLVEEPIYLPSAPREETFEFSDTPIREVFEKLERAYGVEIIFDEEMMANCLLNTSSLANSSFHDKLRLICKGINAKYEILDGYVIISGNGCE